MASPFDVLAAQFTQPGLPVGPSSPVAPPSWVNPLKPTIPATTVPLPNAMPTHGFGMGNAPANIQPMGQFARPGVTALAPAGPARTANPPAVMQHRPGPMTGQVAPHRVPDGVVPYPFLRP